MGIPKFYRYISERYPLISQLIDEDKVPEIDNFYLDFNTIIHHCSHPNDDDPHFRMAEDEIFKSIFRYVDLLFGKIRPRKLLFVAVDGVAPRAKMNQQRSRRFRVAKEAQEIKERAERSGEKLPDGKAFDSNCITPGTIFMARLSEHLRYFVNYKITNDSNWRDIEVIYSGQETPGEGEHKIMEYIRSARAQPGYDPNTRHCLYGLDADLIMLGLQTHEPHFCLLREEVKFGFDLKASKRKSPESTKLYLLHLSLMREYIDLEFRDIEPTLPFKYCMENIIDDFILFSVFAGNDFLPCIPGFHIGDNGLERLFDIYRRVLPKLDGYINESGVICLKRLCILFNEMSGWDQCIFEKEYRPLKWFSEKEAHNSPMAPTIQLADELKLQLRWDDVHQDRDSVVTWNMCSVRSDFDADSDPGRGTGNTADSPWSEWKGADESNMGPQDFVSAGPAREVHGDGRLAKATVGTGNLGGHCNKEVKEKFDEWKFEYYKRLGIRYDDEDAVRAIVSRYFEGLQWIMLYYFRGIPSWSWFYEYHYAPRVSDLQGVGVGETTFNFDIGEPFKPFEQLMAVLPPASRYLVPAAYRDLMSDPNSPILEFYPTKFERDLNGKKNDWEAIVKIPFIDERKLLDSTAEHEHKLTPEERSRNLASQSLTYTRSSGPPTFYPSPAPNVLPSIPRCQCEAKPLDLADTKGLSHLQGLCEGVRLGTEAPAGFPSLQTLPHSAVVAPHTVNVHGSDTSLYKSRNQSILIKIDNSFQGLAPDKIAEDMFGTTVYTGWPYLWEGLVVGVSCLSSRFERATHSASDNSKIWPIPHTSQNANEWQAAADLISATYLTRHGVVTGKIEILLRVRPLKGLDLLESGAFVKEYHEDNDQTVELALQMCPKKLAIDDPRFTEIGPLRLHELFPVNCKVFLLGGNSYGTIADVTCTTSQHLSVSFEHREYDALELQQLDTLKQKWSKARYIPSFQVANILRISPLALSKITSSFLVSLGEEQPKINIGLDMKFDAKGFKVVDYTRKTGRQWEYSDKAIALIKEYKAIFPEVIEYLGKNGNTTPNVSDIFESLERVQQIKNWLEAKSVYDFQKVPLSCEMLSRDQVQELEELLALQAQASPQTVGKKTLDNVLRSAVLKPEHAKYRLKSQRFNLGDRVVMVRDSGPVPLSTRGIVIGVNGNVLDVIWEEYLMLGTTMDGRCATGRGISVDFIACLNLSDPQFKTSGVVQLSPVAQPFVPYNSSRFPVSTPPRHPSLTAPISRVTTPVTRTQNQNRYLSFEIAETGSNPTPPATPFNSIGLEQSGTNRDPITAEPDSMDGWQTVDRRTRSVRSSQRAPSNNQSFSGLNVSEHGVATQGVTRSTYRGGRRGGIHGRGRGASSYS